MGQKSYGSYVKEVGDGKEAEEKEVEREEHRENEDKKYTQKTKIQMDLKH